jgi:hypothetical protein
MVAYDLVFPGLHARVRRVGGNNTRSSRRGKEQIRSKTSRVIKVRLSDLRVGDKAGFEGGPTAFIDTKPITDPLDGWSLPHWTDSPFTFSPPFWDFDTIEDKLSDHLPTSLTRKSLGFSLVGSTFYIFMLGVLGAIMWRLRFSLQAMFKRITRYASRGRSGNGGHVAGRKLTTDSYAIEEGHADGSLPLVGPSWKRPGICKQ